MFRYREHEVELFEEQLDAKAKEQAERIVTGYFSKARAKEDWDRIAVINDKVPLLVDTILMSKILATTKLLITVVLILTCRVNWHLATQIIFEKTVYEFIVPSV